MDFKLKTSRVLAMIVFFLVSLFDDFSFSTFEILSCWLGLFN